MNNAITTPDCILTDLPYVFWIQVLNYLPVFDILNLHVSFKKFVAINLNAKHKLIFKLMDRVCCKNMG